MLSKADDLRVRAIFCIAPIVLSCNVALAQNRYLADSRSRSTMVGSWTIAGPVILERVPLKFFTFPNNSSETAIALSQLRGLTRSQLEPATPPRRHEAVQFDVVREAGTLHLEGYLQAGNGGGNFTFIPSPSFAAEMHSVGIADVSDRNAFVMAVYDVDSTYVRELIALGVRPRSSDQLIGMAAQHVTLEYVRDFYNLGYASLSPADLTGMRVQGVTPDLVRELRDLGYSFVSPNEMIGMRVQGVSPEFIKDVQALGYSHPAINQLIGMRVQGVTPQYIRKVRSMGLGNLSLEQIVNLRVQGVVE